MSSSHAPLGRALALAGMVVFLFSLELHGADHDLPEAPEEDECFFVRAALRIASGAAPGFYGHPGSTQIYPVALLYHLRFAFLHHGRWLHANPEIVDEWSTDTREVFLIARLVAMAYSALALVFIYLLVKQLFDAPTALVATWLAAVTPMVPAMARSARTDGASLFFAALALDLLFRALATPSTRNLVVAGIGLGLAISTKYYLAVFGALLPAIAILEARRARARGDRGSREWVRCGAAGLVALIVFCATTPSVLLRFGDVWSDLRDEARPELYLSFEPGSVPSTLWWYAASALPRMLGWLVMALCSAGTLLAIRERNLPRRLAVGLIVLFIAAISVLCIRWDHWLIPIAPLACGLAAAAVTALAGRAAQLFKTAHARAPLCAAFALLSSLPHLLDVFEESRLAARPSTFKLAREWVFTHLPSESKLVVDPDAAIWVAHDMAFVYPRVLVHGSQRLYVDRVPRHPIAGAPPALEQLRNQGVGYIVLNRSRAARLRSRRPGFVRFYEQVIARGRLLAEFDASAERRGPYLQIFDVSSLPGSPDAAGPRPASP